MTLRSSLWTCTTLGSILEFKYGKALPDRLRSGDGAPVYGSNGIVGYHQIALTSGPTIVVGRKGSVGEVNFSEVPCSPIDTTYYIDNFGIGSPKYWFYFLKSMNLASLNKSTAIPGLSRSDAYPISVDLPPLAEQKRIADKLDTLLARVDDCRERLDRVPSLLRRFRQSVLAAGTSGRLTKSWRDQHVALGLNASEELSLSWRERSNTEKKPLVSPDLSHWNEDLPASWAVASVNQFSECLDRLRVPIKRENRRNLEGHYPYYGANGEVGRIDDYIFDEELVLVTEDETFYGREKPIAYRSSGRCWVNNHAHVLRAQSPEANDYLCYALMYYNVVPWLSGTTGRAKLTQQALNSLPIAVPPQAELVEVVKKIKRLFALADSIEKRLIAGHAIVGTLVPSLLAKAFRGELVPQDPNDEPAAELLKRLSDGQATASNGVRSTRGKRAVHASSPDEASSLAD